MDPPSISARGDKFPGSFIDEAFISTLHAKEGQELSYTFISNDLLRVLVPKHVRKQHTYLLA